MRLVQPSSNFRLLSAAARHCARQHTKFGLSMTSLNKKSTSVEIDSIKTGWREVGVTSFLVVLVTCMLRFITLTTISGRVKLTGNKPLNKFLLCYDTFVKRFREDGQKGM